MLAVAGFKKEPLAACGRPRRTRSFRFLSSCIHSESRCSPVVARLLAFIRRSRRRFPCHAAEATLRIRFGDLDRYARPTHSSEPEGTNLLLSARSLTLRESASCSQRSFAAFVDPLAIEGRLVKASISIGVALYPDDGQLRAVADRAMYLAKRAKAGSPGTNFLL